MKTRPPGMDYGTYKAMCAAKKSQPMDEDAFKALPVDGKDDDADEGGGDEGGEGEGGGSQPPPKAGGDNGGGGSPPPPKKGEGDDDEPEEKSVGLADLRKGIEAFDGVQAAAQVATGGNRETFLSARLSSGTITKSERAELGRIWAGTEPAAQTDAAGRPLRKSLVEYLDPEDQEVVNGAPLLKSLLGGVNERLDAITTRTEAGAEATRQLVLAQGQLLKSACGALIQMDEQLRKRDDIIKALGERLGTVESTPVPKRALSTPLNKGQPRPLARPTGGGNPGNGGGAGGTDLSKAQVVRGLHQLVKAAGDGNDFATAQKLTSECADFERTGRLSAGTKAAVEAIAG